MEPVLQNIAVPLIQWLWGGIEVQTVQQVLELVDMDVSITQATKTHMADNLEQLSLEAFAAVFCGSVPLVDAAAAVRLDVASYLGVQCVVRRLLQSPIVDDIEARARRCCCCCGGLKTISSAKGSSQSTGGADAASDQQRPTKRPCNETDASEAASNEQQRPVPDSGPVATASPDSSAVLKDLPPISSAPVTTVGALAQRVLRWAHAARALPHGATAAQIDSASGLQRSARQTFINCFRCLHAQAFPFTSEEGGNASLTTLKRQPVQVLGKAYDLSAERLKALDKVEMSRWARDFGGTELAAQLRAAATPHLASRHQEGGISETPSVDSSTE
ncbi:hypothetical protein JKP88DRAFT_305069 [Tribonema minus]|uniref:Uncharacterized protein n=1 Tax=Tribonema minus TaxID=303371 RepID=A0A835Z7X1_9STRA|nr:hypothetical protein JKP88DRAFT_305069 [Tribonema minus]